jgi:hypothetical protein
LVEIGHAKKYSVYHPFSTLPPVRRKVSRIPDTKGIYFRRRVYFP